MRIPFTGWDVTVKRSPAFGPARAASSIASRSDPLRFLDPDRLARAIQSFRCGYLREMSDIIDALEERDDTTRSASRKAFAAASRCPHPAAIVPSTWRLFDCSQWSDCRTTPMGVRCMRTTMTMQVQSAPITPMSDTRCTGGVSTTL